MSHPSDTDILQIAEEISPQRVLLIDLSSDEEFVTLLKQHADWNISAIHDGDIVGRIESSGQHDLAILRNTLEYLDKTRAGIVLSRLRDLYSRRLLALAPIDREISDTMQSTWCDSDLIAYGMKLLSSYPDGRHLYEYNILNYKNVPDWLNAKHWANPELWDKHRW
jgi:hypothetical protein